MWEGLTGKRRKRGLLGMVIGIVVASILLYLSFYVSFLYLLIPVILLVILHYTKAWRFTDRAFYGFIAIVVAFFVAMGGISSSIASAPNESTAAISVGSATYDVNFSYFNDSGGYLFNFSLPIQNVTSNAEVALIDLFTNQTVLSTSVTFDSIGTNYSYSWDAGHLSPKAYVVLLTFQVVSNNTTKPQRVEFLGPVLLPFTSLIFLLSGTLIVSYLLITFLFFIAFAFFARAISMSRKRRQGAGQQPPEGGTDQSTSAEEDKGESGFTNQR